MMSFVSLRDCGPSEQIALTVSDVDLRHAVLNVNKSRVAGIDRDRTKTGDDRRLALCPRAIAVLRRHLRLREFLVREGRIKHDSLFSSPRRTDPSTTRSVFAMASHPDALADSLSQALHGATFVGQLQPDGWDKTRSGSLTSMAIASGRCSPCMRARPKARRQWIWQRFVAAYAAYPGECA